MTPEEGLSKEELDRCAGIAGLIVLAYGRREVELTAQVAAAIAESIVAERERCRGICFAVKPHWHAAGCGCTACVTADAILKGIESGLSYEEKT